VDHDQIGLAAKQLGEAHRAVAVRKDIIRYFFRLRGGPCFAHLGAQIGYLTAIFRQSG